MSTWVFGAERWTNLIYYPLSGHKDAIVGCFFEQNSLDVGIFFHISICVGWDLARLFCFQVIEWGRDCKECCMICTIIKVVVYCMVLFF